jgi:hypothetical protein
MIRLTPRVAAALSLLPVTEPLSFTYEQPGSYEAVFNLLRPGRRRHLAPGVNVTSARARLLQTLAMAAVLASSSACGALSHAAKEVHGRVVDDATGSPLPGVIVVGQWQPYYVGPVHAPGHRGVLHVAETVTDAQGRYVIPAWGPKPLPPGAEIRHADPALSFFKPGYLPFTAANTAVSDPAARRTPPGVSEWSGKVVRLKKHSGSPAVYGEALEVLSRGLVEPAENWKRYPKMTYALWQEEMRLPKGAVGPFSRLAPVDIGSLSPEDRQYLESRGR